MAEKELTEFQKQKILHVFGILYDCDSDGYLSEEDFKITFDKIKKNLNWGADNPKCKKTKDALEHIWQELRKLADADNDNKVTEKEWMLMWTDAISKDTMPSWQKTFMDFMFDVNDSSGDNVIDAQEYKMFYKNYISDDECDQAFQIISKGHNITKEEFRKLWKEYFMSEDKSDAGNYLFGMPDFMKS